MLKEDTIISKKEARKLLSKRLQQKLTDDQVEAMVVRLESIAREFIRSTVPKND